MRSESEVRAALRAWIVEHGNGVSARDLTDETPLIESGILRSPQVLELLLHIEALRDGRITVSSLAPGMFKNIDTLLTSFFGETRADV